MNRYKSKNSLKGIRRLLAMAVFIVGCLASVQSSLAEIEDRLGEEIPQPFHGNGEHEGIGVAAHIEEQEDPGQVAMQAAGTILSPIEDQLGVPVQGEINAEEAARTIGQPDIAWERVRCHDWVKGLETFLETADTDAIGNLYSLTQRVS